MDLLRCDSCGKPLGEGALGRGDAIRRDDFVICSTCELLESNGRELPLSPPEVALAKWAALKRSAPDQSESDDDTEVYDESEWDTDPIENPEDQSACEIEIDGRRTSGRIERDASGRKIIVLEESDSKAKSTRVKKAMLPSGRRVSLPSRRAPLALKASPKKRDEIEIEVPERKESRTFTAVAILMLAFALPSLAVATYFALKTQDDYNNLANDWNTKLAELYSEVGVLSQEVARERATRNQRASDQPVKVEQEPVQAEPQVPDTEIAPSREVRAAIDGFEERLAQPILKQLASEDVGIRILGLKDAIAMRAVKAAPRIRELLKSANNAERQLAADALGALRDIDSMHLLMILSNEDSSDAVQMAARRAMSQIDGEVRDLDLAAYDLDELKALKERLKAQSSSKQIREALNEVDMEIGRRELAQTNEKD